MFSLKGKLALWILSLLLIGSISACNFALEGASRGNFTIDATFSDFYREMGGDKTLGPAISTAFGGEGITYQYVVSGLMVYDPNKETLKRFYFSPLASVEWHIDGLVEPESVNNTTAYINGHLIWEEAWSFYNQYGADIIGLPLTSVSANDAKQRYEQYFEGLGFYRNYADQPGQIHLMPYGYWMCGGECPYTASDATPPSGSYQRDNSETELLFLQAAGRFGYGFAGAPLMPPHQGSDGFYEMVFQNLILYLDPSNGGQIRLRPLPGWLGIQADLPRTETKEDWLSFYPTEGGLGFNVPNSFITYLNEHGSLEEAGKPITEYSRLNDNGYSQCFANLCLEYHPTAPQNLRIRPHSLGAEYLSMGSDVSATGSQVTEALQINVWEDNPLIPSGHSQGINIEATKNNEPVSGINLSLVVTQPNGITKTYTLSPTNADGKTRIDLDPINGSNGAIVQYEVCVLGDSSPQICFSRSYTIWEQ